jgi:hypothetical protein
LWVREDFIPLDFVGFLVGHRHSLPEPEFLV